MIRKQLYIEEAQDKALKRRAKELGVTEAEVVRRALDEALCEKPISKETSERMEVLEELFREAEELSRTYSLPSGYRFDRQALYEEDKRFKRWDKD